MRVFRTDLRKSSRSRLFRTFALVSNSESPSSAGGLCWFPSRKQLSKSRRYPRPGIGVKVVGHTDVGVPECLTGGMDAVHLIDQ